MNRRRALLGMLTLLLLCGAVALAAACGGDDDDASSAATTQGKGSPTAKAAATTAGVTGTGSPQSALGKKINETRVPEEMANGQRIGAENAKVVVEAFEDFGCPHCLDYTATVEPMLMSEYVATGKVAIVYRFFPLRQLTANAAIAAYCAGEQGKFWPYHRMLFVAQAEANDKKGPALTDAFGLAGLEKMAADLSLDAAKFDTCMTSDPAITAVQGDLKMANTLGLPGTPSFVINGNVTETPETLAGWRKLLDGLLK